MTDSYYDKKLYWYGRYGTALMETSDPIETRITV